MRHIADDGLATFIHGHMLHPHRLVASAAVSLKRLQLEGEGPCQLVKSPLRAVLLRNVVYVIEPASECHRRIVDRRHLSRQHRLQLIARFDARHHGEHEIELSLVDNRTLRRGIGELREEPIAEVGLGGAERVHEEQVAEYGVGMVGLQGDRVSFHRSPRADRQPLLLPATTLSF